MPDDSLPWLATDPSIGARPVAHDADLLLHGLPARLAGDLLEAADFLRAFGEPLQLARLGAAELAQALSSPPSGSLWRKLNLLQVQLLRLLLADPSAARWCTSGLRGVPALGVHAARRPSRPLRAWGVPAHTGTQSSRLPWSRIPRGCRAVQPVFERCS